MACRGGGFPHQASQSSQVVPDVGLEDKGLVSGLTVAGQPFETPGLEGGVASFDGVASAVVESFPGGRAHREVTYQAEGVIGREAFGDVDDAAVGGVVGTAIGTLLGWIADVFEGSHRLGFVAASLETRPLMAVALGIMAVGSVGVAVGADRAAFVIVAPQRPEVLVLIGFVSAQVNYSTGTKVVIDGVEEDFVAEGGVARHGIHSQVRVESVELEEQGGGGVLQTGIGGQEIVEQDEAEAADRIGHYQG